MVYTLVSAGRGVAVISSTVLSTSSLMAAKFFQMGAAW